MKTSGGLLLKYYFIILLSDFFYCIFSSPWELMPSYPLDEILAHCGQQPSCQEMNEARMGFTCPISAMCLDLQKKKNRVRNRHHQRAADLFLNREKPDHMYWLEDALFPTLTSKEAFSH